MKNTRNSHCRPCFVYGALVIIVISVCMPAASQDQKTLMPIDEAASRPDFFTFRAQLQGAIARHDVSALLDVVDPDIKNNFGGDDGVKAFQQIWDINDAGSKLWTELATVLALGGTFSGSGKDEFTAPYTFSAWPQDVDGFDYVAVIGSNVRVRAQPSTESATIASISFSLLALDAEATATDWQSAPWTAVKVEGKKGYIATRFIRSPIDYRARFTYSGGRWRLTLFLAGD